MDTHTHGQLIIDIPYRIACYMCWITYIYLSIMIRRARDSLRTVITSDHLLSFDYFVSNILFYKIYINIFLKNRKSLCNPQCIEQSNDEWFIWPVYWSEMNFLHFLISNFYPICFTTFDLKKLARRLLDDPLS